MESMKRREFIKLCGSSLVGGVTTGCAQARGIRRESSEKKSGGQPNILVILVDDLGYGDLSCYGAADLRTPHIDLLANEGIRFDNFYSNCPVCSPTRAALLSGRYQEMVGVPGVIRTHADNSWGNLISDCVLLPEILKADGYSTALIGKWHLGLQSPDTPNDRGFDFFHGFLGDMMDDYYNHRRHGINYMRRDRQEIDPQGHATGLFTQWACDYLRRAEKSKPFFLYLAYNAPHTPIQPPQKWLDRIRKREPDMNEKRAALGALIEHMDDGIGQVLAALRETGLDSNTIVVFTSDNGGLLRVGANNGPVRDGKGSLYEGGIRVPACVRWPGRIKAGSRTKRIALTMDIMPTLLDATGISISHEIDGLSFLPELSGERQSDPQRDLFFGRREGGSVFQGKTIEAIRRGDWKLLRPQPDAPLELYNLRTDPRERKDLAGIETRIYKELSAALDAQLKRYGKVTWQP